ncbi:MULTISPECIES: hypothetical protein [unclassified Cyanobium]|uniref:hypothetical protein n=1 Tax=unclassified Cyanobium TaxID=2627006 RepID=UPI0020CCF61D|nr:MULTISPECIES: hypothetical protein [unclassified Cyanobium]MCP9833902.1 hypothetical protein [Cyanobium sp. La Preciosa 7G6]MCP9936666.1 hypothetical protein [Cyanobium sp. Aljojuca 7A6]
MASDTPFRPSETSVLADRLSVFAMALFVIYGVRVAATAIPFRPLDTLWQLSISSALIEAAAIPLVGLGLLHLAAYLDPDNSALVRRKEALARWAILAVLGFLLLVPVQALASWSTVATARARLTTQQTTANRNFALVREAISAATSLEDLQARLQSLQSPELGIRFENLGLPLPETKRQMLIRLNEIEEQVKTRIIAPPPEAIENVASNAGRLMATSFVYALAFAIAAQRRGQDIPLLVELLTIWSVRRQAGRPPRGATGAPDGDYFAQLAPPDDDPTRTP